MKSYTKAIAALMLTLVVMCAACKKDNENGGGNAPEGAIDGLFTINSAGDKVYFSQGNLQYDKTTNEWSFMEHQYDVAESADLDVGVDYADQNVVGLFCWGTSGYDHGAVCYQPWRTNTYYNNYHAYGIDTANLYDQTGQADWGCNAISNGGNITNTWRTLTKEEWDYVLYTRNTNSQIRFVKACVNNLWGVIILPDDWNSSYYTLNNINSATSHFINNTITVSQWSALEKHGAVFLPAAGVRVETKTVNMGASGNYWSSTREGDHLAYLLHFCWTEADLSTRAYGRFSGCSVRLVRDAQ